MINYVKVAATSLKLEIRLHAHLVMPTSHIQRSLAEIVDRLNVTEFQIRQGAERIFCLKCTLYILDGARAVPFEN